VTSTNCSLDLKVDESPTALNLLLEGCLVWKHRLTGPNRLKSFYRSLRAKTVSRAYISVSHLIYRRHLIYQWVPAMGGRAGSQVFILSFYFLDPNKKRFQKGSKFQNGYPKILPPNRPPNSIRPILRQFLIPRPNLRNPVPQSSPHPPRPVHLFHNPLDPAYTAPLKAIHPTLLLHLHGYTHIHLTME
jgi:hypothetical protein